MRLFVDNLTNIDFSYLCNERGLLGETWLASIELEGGLDHQGMVCDFGIVKKSIRDWLDKTLDHCLLAPAKSPNLETTSHPENDATSVKLEFGPNADSLACTSPQEAITLVDVDEITPEKVASWCESQLDKLFPDTVSKIRLSFTSEAIEDAFYHYSHGLKKHEGNCQRIAHGHRSKILIWRNGELDKNLMREWAQKWTDIYLGTNADLLESKNESYAFEYEAQQGQFYLELPKRCCYLIDTDSTVELIAEHIGRELAKHFPEDKFLVKAFEGIGKGAIVEV